MTLAMQNHKVLGSSLTVLDWVRATLLDLEVEINARKKNMTDDRDICERLEDPSYDGAIYMRQDAAKEIRALRAKVKKQEELNSLRAMDIVTLGQEVGRLREAKDGAYEERNRVVALLASVFPSGVRKTAIPGWEPEWHDCVYIDLPTGQASWHYHDSQAHLFAHLPPYRGEWDGHTTDVKYERVARAALAGKEEK